MNTTMINQTSLEGRTFDEILNDMVIMNAMCSGVENFAKTKGIEINAVHTNNVMSLTIAEEFIDDEDRTIFASDNPTETVKQLVKDEYGRNISKIFNKVIYKKLRNSMHQVLCEINLDAVRNLC